MPLSNSIANSLLQTSQIAHDFVKSLTPGAGATLVCLSGDLGSGKTTFTKALAAAIGVTETITSPTFVIEKIYELTGQPFSFLIHIDAYRLEKEEELLHLGWNEIIKNPENLIVLEWPEKVSGIIPEGAITISLAVVDENSREITVTHGK